METTARKGDLRQLEEVVRKVFEYTPPAKGEGGKRAATKRGVKHRRRELAGKGPARSG